MVKDKLILREVMWLIQGHTTDLRGPPDFDVLANAVHGAMSLPPPTWGSCTGPAEQDSHSDPGTQSGNGCHAWLS